MRIGVVRIKRERPAIAGYCFVQLALILEYIPQVVIRIGVIRVKRERHAITGYCFVQLALFLEHNPQVVVRIGIIRPERECLPDKFNGNFVLPRLMGNQT